MSSQNSALKNVSVSEIRKNVSDAEGESALSELSTTISNIASYNQKLRLLLKRATTSQPSSRRTLIKQLQTLKEQCLESVLKAEELLKTFSITEDPLERLRRQKVSDDLQRTISTFRSLLEDLKRLETNQIIASDSLLPVVSRVSHSVTEKTEAPLRSQDVVIQIPEEQSKLQSQQQLQKNISYDSTTTEFLRERQEAIREIETSISEVNSIFKDLAIMIKEQGLQVEELGSSIENTVVQTESAVDQLTKAKARRARRRKRIFICLLFLFLLLFMFVAVAVS
ncbi:Syntaxin-12 [Galdieria sulphuraria]|uniref:Syntaxin isoform 1 n=2 Tax=Galdieria sulphuraria TaxID=130081 RepID=M2VSJ2_GALSU|nr:syntaxin isoform 1 [Galdieria sulphuraria]XP_005702631.1 syntaxin isoform 2 [Galdieria sulphuraria]EME26110.1 syntaxin isoform 1 [Galdieria sulphuraria]EME26111.1 syntaxin isoform 2 [Galdieria sulphuraria]GJD05592.1 Syntaxin-12 [Galdieria sulphuraria]|eukprot:XP_005702630.1 syntaxin isoform 1 [Galdieria sulphuraria]